MIWQVRETYLVDGPDQCIFEIDPVAKVVTGKQICGPWGNFPPIVGLAYDYATDTYYVGDALGGITHVDGAGSVLDSGHIWTQIAGLAYNPTTRHLFVESFQPDPPLLDGYIVDPAHGYATLSGFLVMSDGVPAIAGRGVSLEADCAGHLWTYDVFNNVVYEYESGEPGWCVNDIPWLSEDPASGTIPGSGGGAGPTGAANTLPVTVTFDSNGVLPGLYQRSLVFTTDTPDPVAPVPVDFTVLFSDVPQDSFAWNFIYGAAGAGVMTGCAPQAPLYAFCPAEVVTRRTMAGYIERAVHGALAPPPVYLAEFHDVLLGSFNADYIQGLVDDGITAGCGGGNYCPDVPVTRAQMAVFVWKGQHGAEAPSAVRASGNVRRRAVPGRIRGGLHRRHRRRGRHGRVRQRKLLPEREHHERADGRVPGEGVRHSLPAVALGVRSGARAASGPPAIARSPYDLPSRRAGAARATRRRLGRRPFACPRGFPRSCRSSAAP